MLSVLYVDDEPALLELARLFLERTGEFQVATSTSAQEALADPAIRSYDAIISDYQMPEMDGIAFLKVVREQLGDIPFILFTGKGREEVVIEAINNGADFYLQKGGDPKAQFAELAHKIRQAVRRKRAEATLAESRDYLHRIYASVQGGIVIIDAGTHEILDLNPAAARMIGTTKDRIAGRICHRCICPAEQGKCPITDLHREVDNAECTLLTADGEEIDIIKSVVPFNVNGRECLLETLLDNTERKKAADELHAAYAKVTAAEGELRENFDLLSRKEQALRESTETFRAVVEQSSEGIIIVDFTGRLLYANHRAADIAESPGDLDTAGGINVLDFVTPEMRERAVRDFARVLQDDDRFLVNYRIVSLAGREKWLECIGRKISFKGSSAMLLSFRDATARMQAEQALRDSEHKFATVFKSNPVPLTLVSATDGVFIDVNDAFSQNTGYARTDVIGTTPEELGLFVDRDEYILFIAALREKRSVQGMELRCRTRAGEIRTCRFSSSAILIDGRPRILSMVVDITEQKQVEEAVRESGERYRLILKNAHEGILVNELTPRGPGKFIDVNEAACRILGMTRDELQDVRLVDLDTPDMKKRIPVILGDFMENKHVVFQTRYLTKDNREKFIDISASLFDINGQATMLSVIRDITEFKAAESALSALVAGMVGTTGRVSLDRIAESIHTWLGADCIMIGEITPDHERVQVLSMLLDGEKIQEYSYSLKGTPCENAAEKGYCVYPDNVAAFFPESPDIREFNIRGYAGTPLRNAGGLVVGILCILSRTPLILPRSAQEILDVIAAKAAAEIERLNALGALSESEKKFRVLGEHSLDGILILDPGGAILFANHAAGSIIEAPDLDEIVGTRNVMEFIAPASQQDAIRDFAEVAKGVDGYIARYKIHTVKQEERWVESIGKSIVFQGARGILISLRDVTERQRAEDALRQSEEKFRIIFENSPYPIAINSLPDNRFLEVNTAFLAASGYSEEEVIGRNPVEMGLVSFADAARLISRRLLKGKIENVPLALTASGGRRIHVIFSTMPVTIDGRSAIVTVTVETTGLKRVEEELLQKNAELTAVEEELREQCDTLLSKELELIASEGRYRTLFENMLDGFAYCRMIYDDAGNPDDCIYLQVNPAFLQLTGFDDVIGERMTDVIPEIRSQGPELFEIFGRVARSGIPEVFEFFFKPLAKWLKISVYSPERDSFATVIEDITDRIQAEEALQKSEEMLELVMNGVPTLLAYMDTGLRFVYINEPHAAWHGRPRDELVGKSLEELLPEDVFSRSLPRYRMVLDGQEVTYERRTRDRGGREHFFAVHLVPHILEGRVAGFFAALTDITERKQMEEALKESEARFHSLFERHGSIMLLVESETGKILDANLAAEEFYGRARDELCSVSMQDFSALSPETVSPDRTDAAWVQDAYFISPQRVAGGEVRTVEVHSSPVSMNGRTILFSIINDVTERQQAEDALRQANKKLNLLSGITRHDINNQLQILNGYAALLCEMNPDPSLEPYLSNISVAGSRIASMIQFTKEYEEIGVRLPVWQNLHALVNDAGEDADLGRLVLVNDIPTRLEVFADPLISKVFFNLIKNARRHGGKITTVRFASGACDEGCIVVCEDDGDGVAPDLKERIFDSGFGKNTGFGLFISREILDITDITINETGDAGSGARFVITIPKGQHRVAPQEPGE